MQIGAFKRDVKASEEGEWVNDIPGCGDLSLKVRGLKSRRVVLAQTQLERKVSKADRNADGTLKTEIALDIMCKILHEHVLIDWRNLKDGETTIEYNKELATEWLTNPEYDEFGDAVVFAAQMVDNRRAEKLDDAAKNLEAPSGQSSKPKTATKP